MAFSFSWPTEVAFAFPWATEETVLRDTRREISLEWEIKKFHDLLNKEDYKIDSDKFMIQDDSFFLRICPSGEKGNNTSDWMTVCLMKKTFRSEQKIHFRVEFKDTFHSVFESGQLTHSFCEESAAKGFILISKLKLQKRKDVIAKNGSLTLLFHARLVNDFRTDKESQITSDTGRTLETLSQNFKELFLSEIQGDIVIQVNDKKFVGHRSVLAARSSVFRTMLEVDMAEKNDGVININDCDEDCLKSFLLFIYSGNLNVVSLSNAFGLYYVADKYNVKELKEYCSQFLARMVTVDTICDVVKLAELYEESELLSAATKFFVDNGDAIVCTTNWFKFLREHPNMANELIVKMAKKVHKVIFQMKFK